MQASETTGEIAKALVATQMEITNVTKDAKNPHFKSTYATLAAVLDVVRPALAAHGVAVVQGLVTDHDRTGVVTRLLHGSGEWLESAVFAPMQKMDAQNVGACATYLRRYALAAMVGVAQEDDDGNAASTRPSPANDRTAPTSRSEALRPAQGTPAQGNGHTDDWSAVKMQFFSDLKNLDLKYQDVADWLAETSRTKRRPSQMSRNEVGELVDFLHSGGGKAKVLAWVAGKKPTGDAPLFDDDLPL